MSRQKFFPIRSLFVLTLFGIGSAAEVIQIDVRAILNARSVTTLTEGKLVTWTRGIDGGGSADGYLTREAASFVGDKNIKALPGDAFFPATGRHPDVRLNYTNADGEGGQTCCVAGAGEFGFAVPLQHYGRVLLFLTSAEGASELAISLHYADGTTERHRKRLPDYYNAPPADDADLFVLAEGLGKWDIANLLTEKDHHFVHGLELHPDPAKPLKSVQVEKSKAGYLVFWGATGVTE